MMILYQNRVSNTFILNTLGNTIYKTLKNVNVFLRPTQIFFLEIRVFLYVHNINQIISNIKLYRLINLL
jgi:hypothetical protein